MNVYMAILLSISGLVCQSGNLIDSEPNAEKEWLVSAEVKEKTSVEELRKMYGQFSALH